MHLGKSTPIIYRRLSKSPCIHNQFHIYSSEGISDEASALWDYLTTLMTELNIEPHDEAIIAIAYDTRFVERNFLKIFFSDIGVHLERVVHY